MIGEIFDFLKLRSFSYCAVHSLREPLRGEKSGEGESYGSSYFMSPEKLHYGFAVLHAGEEIHAFERTDPQGTPSLARTEVLEAGLRVGLRAKLRTLNCMRVAMEQGLRLLRVCACGVQPVVGEHIVQIGDSGVLGHAQEQVEIFAGTVDAKGSGAFEHGGAKQECGVSDGMPAVEKIAPDLIVIEGEGWCGAGPSSLVNVSESGSQHADGRVSVHVGDLALEASGQRDIIGIDEGEVFRVASLDNSVAGCALALTTLRLENGQAWVLDLDGEEVLEGGVGGAVVDGDEAEVAKGLLEHGLNGFLEIRHGVIHWHNNRKSRGWLHSVNLSRREPNEVTYSEAGMRRRSGMDRWLVN